MQDTQKLQSMILEYLQNITQDMSLIKSTQVVKDINKIKKIQKESKSKLKHKSKINSDQKQTIHYKCIKCQILYINLQDAKTHQEVEHPDKNNYIKQKLLEREKKVQKKQNWKNKLYTQDDQDQQSEENNLQGQEKIEKLVEGIQSDNDIYMGADQ